MKDICKLIRKQLHLYSGDNLYSVGSNNLFEGVETLV